jgi:hypothetical protein
MAQSAERASVYCKFFALPHPQIGRIAALAKDAPARRAGVYDRHAFSREKRDAFEALAAQIERTLNPADNVVPLRGRKAG